MLPGWKRHAVRAADNRTKTVVYFDPSSTSADIEQAARRLVATIDGVAIHIDRVRIDEYGHLAAFEDMLLRAFARSQRIREPEDARMYDISRTDLSIVNSSEGLLVGAADVHVQSAVGLLHVLRQVRAGWVARERLQPRRALATLESFGVGLHKVANAASDEAQRLKGAGNPRSAEAVEYTTTGIRFAAELLVLARGGGAARSTASELEQAHSAFTQRLEQDGLTDVAETLARLRRDVRSTGAFVAMYNSEPSADSE